MKRLAMAVVALTAFAVAAEAGSPFEPVRLVNHMRAYNYTHYVRGPREGQEAQRRWKLDGRSASGPGAHAEGLAAAGQGRLSRPAASEPVEHPVDDDA